MSSGTQPDSPVGQHRNGCEGCEHPENAYPPCWTDEQVTADQEHMRQLILGGAVGGNGVETGAGSAAPGRTGVILPKGDFGSGNDDSGDLSGSVWRVGRSWGRTIVLQAGEQPAKAAGGDKLIGVMDTPELARIVVDAVNARRVSVDDDTARRIGLVIRDALSRVSAQDYDTPALAWAEIGRAAVQALRDWRQS